MENEIEKLKQIYLKTEAPVELDFYGFEDVLDRTNNRRKNSFYIYRYVGLALVVFVMLSGLAGITFASKPNSTLYPIKVAAQNAIANITHSDPKHVEDTIDSILTPRKVTPTLTPVIIQSAPTPSPTPIVKKKIEIENEEDNRNIEIQYTQQKGEKNKIEHKEEVKGVNTSSEPEKKDEPQPSQQQSQGSSQEHRQDQNDNQSHKENSSNHERD